MTTGQCNWIQPKRIRSRLNLKCAVPLRILPPQGAEADRSWDSFADEEDLKPGSPVRKTSILRRLIYGLLWLAPLTFILLACLSGTIMSQVEQPKYTVLESEGNIEIRQYAPVIVAEVEVRGERMQALNQGFRLIADYIFGNNLSSKNVAMTAPVTQEVSEKIAMTAPVTQDGVGDVWKVRFVMPGNYTLDSLPKPKNNDVRLMSIPARKLVVIRFSGFNTNTNIGSHQEMLLKYIADNHLAVAGQPTTAFYNPPWTLPFLRRNEIMVELR